MTASSNSAAPVEPGQSAAERSRALRDTLGHFATGVTVVTTLDASGEPVGMTVNSFNSVSLDPALILWSIDRSSLSYAAFTQSERFVVHVLKGDQQHVSNLFAGRGADKFGQVKWHRGPENVPQLDDCAALFHCRRTQNIEGGDHTIMLGEVLEFSASGGEPLVFHCGGYRALAGE
ncbi:flavin reductase family protein [Microbulbifer hydrolyticus]|uniref:Flavin reductase n=1 Tax=Microbulbifer hydrolyticus TaxID=48074 RepID=A0A6P1TAH3_9GAMM|nr:flavin reductase family protein [Microbulbifer hydrolyticus]MBB5212105.1 flavin reductase (DIM6/NTAB) family NADH-FMN oxidoreductase RutF [Microbulbifer hydrolyticus]QHQ39778.1 flavin reductase [Microbulbifer hydrolyticus]